MKKKVLIVVLLIVGAAVAGTLTRTAREEVKGPEEQPGAEQSAQSGQVTEGAEIRQRYQLQPGAQVDVSGVNGKLEVETSDTDTAELYIERKARKPEDLKNREITIEQTADRLSIRVVQKKSMGLFSWGNNGAGENVTLKLPRKVSLKANGVNGAVKIGEVEGALAVSGVNGRVELAQARDYTEVSGVNGPVGIAMNQIGERGLKITGVNGGIELRLRAGVNADLLARGMNGSVRSDVPEVVVEKDDEQSRYSAKIGSGGAPINISGINGSVKITRNAA